jgi:hypothetical protein
VKCQQQGCDSGARWTGVAHLECPEPGGERKRVGLNMSSVVCDAHTDKLRELILANKETITTTLWEAGGFHEPDWLAMRVELVPLDLGPPPVINFCARAGCRHMAHWRVRQLFKFKGGSRVAYSAMTNITVCNQHRADTSAADFAKGDMLKRTVDMLKRSGIKGLDVKHCEIEFVPIQGAPVFESAS